jgi:site-specific recombinase XerD
MAFLQPKERIMATSTTTTVISPLRQRMQHDMLMRGLGPHTQHDYIRHVRRFAAFLRRPPDTATSEDIRRFQLHQHENGVGPATINGTVSALRFFSALRAAGADSGSPRASAPDRAA